MTLQRRVGRLIAGHRARLGLRQGQLAEQANLSRHMIAKIETGAASPSLAAIERIAAALAVDPAELLTPELIGRPSERRALTELIAELAPLSDQDLSWVGDIVRAALKARR